MFISIFSFEWCYRFNGTQFSVCFCNCPKVFACFFSSSLMFRKWLTKV